MKYKKFVITPSLAVGSPPPANKNDHPLLSRLYHQGQEEPVTDRIEWASLAEGLRRIRDIAKDCRIGVLVCGNIKRSQTVLLWDMGVTEMIGAINLRPWLEPLGNFEEGDEDALELAVKAGERLFEVGSPDYKTLIPIPESPLFVREDPTPDYAY